MIYRLVSNYAKISSKKDCKQVKVVNKGQSKMNKKLLMKAREKMNVDTKLDQELNDQNEFQRLL